MLDSEQIYSGLVDIFVANSVEINPVDFSPSLLTGIQTFCKTHFSELRGRIFPCRCHLWFVFDHYTYDLVFMWESSKDGTDRRKEGSLSESVSSVSTEKIAWAAGPKSPRWCSSASLAGSSSPAAWRSCAGVAASASARSSDSRTLSVQQQL